MFRLLLVLLFIKVSVLNAGIGIDYLNSLRTTAGLNALSENTELSSAAQNHSDYMQTNNVIGHGENSSDSGFTGENASDRAIYAGYYSRNIGENISYGSPTVEGSIDGLFSAIYHRFGFLSMNLDKVGIGISDNNIFYTYNMGNDALNVLCQGESYSGSGGYYVGVCADTDKHISTTDYENATNDIKENGPNLVFWPPENATDIPPVFYEESPDPLPNDGVTGYPISVEFNDYTFSTAPTVDSLTVTNTAEESLSAIVLMNKDNDPNNKFSAYQHTLFLENRLEWGSKYYVEFIYTLEGVQTTKNWCFTTRSLLNKSSNFYRIENSTSVEFNVKAGESYVIYVVPNDTNDVLGSISYSYNTNTLSASYIDYNTLLITLTGSEGSYANFSFANGQEIKLTIATTDTATTPTNEICSVENSYIDGDFNNNGISDLLWRSGNTNHLWQMQADGSHNYVNIGSKSSTYSITGLGDLNGDGITDILWRKGDKNYIWYMNTDGSHTYKQITSKSYTVKAIKDFNGDGIADILWRKDNKNHIWYMNEDGSHTYQNIGSKSTLYNIADTGDLNGDGITDILWRKGDKNYIWYMNTDGSHTYKQITSKSYTVKAIKDFNGDGIADILWRKGSSNHIWYMHTDGSHIYKNIGTKSTAYTLVKTGDYNGDGIADILWRKDSSNYLWYMHADGTHTYKKISNKDVAYIIQ